MGWFSAIGESFMSGVGKVAEVATGGAVGQMISDALAKFGLPPAICNVMAMMGDPSYSTKAICEQIDEVGKALGLPEELTGALKRIVKKADEYAKAFAQGGFGAVVCAIGEDLGLPPVLYEAIAAAIDTYTGNAAGAAQHLTKLATECAKLLGVPASATHLLELGADVWMGNTEAVGKDLLKVGLDVVDLVDMPSELKDGLNLAVHAYVGDADACVADTLKLAVDVGQRLGLPPEAGALVSLAYAYTNDDNDLMKAAGKELAKGVIGRLDLPPMIKGALYKGAEAGIDNADKVAEGIKKAPEFIKNLPAETKAGAQACYDFISNLGQDKTGGKDDNSFMQALGKLMEEAKSHLSPEQKSALEIATHIAKRDKPALEKDLAELQKRNGDSEVIAIIRRILTGDSAALEQGNPPAANDNNREVANRKLMMALRG